MTIQEQLRDLIGRATEETVLVLAKRNAIFSNGTACEIQETDGERIGFVVPTEEVFELAELLGAVGSPQEATE